MNQQGWHQPRYKCFQWAEYLFWWLRRLAWCDQPARHLLVSETTNWFCSGTGGERGGDLEHVLKAFLISLINSYLANVPKPTLLLLCPCCIFQGSTKMLPFAAKMPLLCCVNAFLMFLGMYGFKSLVLFGLAKQVMGVAVSCWHFEGNGKRQNAIIQVRMHAEHFYYCYLLFYGHPSSAALQRRQSKPSAQLV